MTQTVSIVSVPECAELAKNVHAHMREAMLRYQRKGTLPPFDARNDVVLVNTKIFADGNARPKVLSTIRRTEVFLFYSMPLREPEKGMARLAQILNAIHLADPTAVRVVMPYFEGRQDRKDEERTPMTAKVMARMIEGERSVRGFITFDLHADQLMLAFENPVENLWGQLLLARHAKAHFAGQDLVGVVAPDVGSAKRAEKFAKKSGFPLMGIIEKKRGSANNVDSMRYIGDPLAGFHVILPDDLIDTGGTTLKAREKIIEEGARGCTAYCTHWLASPKGEMWDPLFRAEAKFRNAKLSVVTTNTIPRDPVYRMENADIVTIVSCDIMLAEAIIESLTPGGSVSKLSE